MADHIPIPTGDDRRSHPRQPATQRDGESVAREEDRACFIVDLPAHAEKRDLVGALVGFGGVEGLVREHFERFDRRVRGLSEVGIAVAGEEEDWIGGVEDGGVYLDADFEGEGEEGGGGGGGKSHCCCN